MMKSNQSLFHPADFDNAMFFAVPITVWQDGELIDYGGPIKKHDEDAVMIKDGYFLKAVCEFKVR